MSNHSITPVAVNMEEPLNAFPQCHANILSQLQVLGELPALAAAGARARTIAAESLALFEHAVINHHAEE
ncbi:MAG: hemerythrin protein, partial [Ramlibacter sp.]|nr:hemerythrin protein [Ramlibacter sp.]